MTKVGLLITGNEVLYAKTRDTNGPFMASRLVSQGVPVVATMTCADDRAELVDCLTYLSGKCDAIVTTGGLGPTADDLTAEVVAAFFQRPTAFHTDAWAHCVSYFQKLGRPDVPESNKKQAQLPQGAALIPNPNGTAVGFMSEGHVVSGRHVKVYALPGVPYELEPMFLDFVLPELTRSGLPPVVHVWQVLGVGESAMQQALGDLEHRFRGAFPDATVSYQAHFGYITYSLTVFPGTEDQARHARDFFLGEARPEVARRLAGRVLYETAQTLPAYLVTEWTRRQWTMSFAESCTGGLVSQFVCGVSGASAIFPGSIISYGNETKVRVLGVDHRLIQAHGAVSAEVAHAMALRACSLFGTDVALALTGVAGPRGGTQHKPVGTVFLGMAIRPRAVEPNEKALSDRLAPFGWKSYARVQGDDAVCYVSALSLPSHLKRDVIQNRAGAFGLASLCLLAPERPS